MPTATFPRDLPGLRAGVRMLPFLLLAGCGTPITPPEGTAPPPPEPNLHRFGGVVSEVMEQNGIGAGLVGVMRNGEIVVQQGFGSRDSAGATPLPADALMRIASVSKPLTAAAVRHLAASGALEIDDPAFDLDGAGSGLLRVDPYPGAGDPRLRQITVRHLLEHRGGWDRESRGDPTFMEVEIAAAMGVESPPGRERTLSYILGQPLQFAPGSRSAYSNVGYLALGLLVESVSGEDLISYVHRHLLAPLGVAPADLIAGRTLPEDRDPREPWYQGAGQMRSVFEPNGGMVPGPDGGWHHEARIAQGGMVASTAALLHFLAAYQVAGDGIGSVRAGNEGGGWRWNHTGSLPGTDALARQRGDGVSYVVIFNRRPASGTGYAALVRDRFDAMLDAGEIVWQ